MSINFNYIPRKNLLTIAENAIQEGLDIRDKTILHVEHKELKYFNIGLDFHQIESVLDYQTRELVKRLDTLTFETLNEKIIGVEDAYKMYSRIITSNKNIAPVLDKIGKKRIQAAFDTFYTVLLDLVYAKRPELSKEQFNYC